LKTSIFHLSQTEVCGTNVLFSVWKFRLSLQGEPMFKGQEMLW